MPKIQTLGVGKYIRSIRGMKAVDSKGMNIEIWQIVSNQGNSFLCMPVPDPSAWPLTVDTSRHFFVNVDTDVQEVNPTPSTDSFFNLETGDTLLLEDGGKLVLES